MEQVMIHRSRALEELRAAAALGDDGAAWAFKVLTGSAKSGRPPLDDAAAIAAVQRLKESGQSYHAISEVARASRYRRPANERCAPAAAEAG
jgi:hypothetical protein